ncbi:DDHD domain-containing protein [Sodiomyces alkalinus F11]|uniref:DDHD domain-containing protein n=1 Tax=Sodiomyces alkalinus (strain CBS 110278 / VKM F-3762 / F11) TaxID=1314773 RepID=A0A3N2PKB3_SODAK|nr:DDHD domain-containing protein [Sodiomyces alkalinus F11]ROT34945.1 DDHD domain-containing protein [Sodiomyces alkalinus F11]
MSSLAHTYGENCRLAPVSRPVQTDDGSDEAPPIAAQFFYTSLIPIDDPPSHGTIAGVSEAKSTKGRLRLFSAGDNNALEKAWLSIASEQGRRTHQEARKSKTLSPALTDANASKLASLIRHIVREHRKKHGDLRGPNPLVPPSALEPTTPSAACCAELHVDVSTELQNSFCALLRRRHASLSQESVVQDVMMEMRGLSSEPAAGDAITAASGEHTEPIVSGKGTFESPSTDPRRFPNAPSQSGQGEEPLSSSVKGGGQWMASRAIEDIRRPRTPTFPPRHSANDGISGTPFARVESHSTTPEAGTPILSPVDRPAGMVAENERRRVETVPGRSDRAPSLAASDREIDSSYKTNTVDVPVGVSRLHMVSLPALQMKPIYWSPVNDIAVVLRATWFYRDTMLPVPSAVANQLESGYQELRPYTETWNDELRCAIDVGPLGEEKVSHRLWPERPGISSDEGLGADDTAISTDPFCAARCFRGEAAAQGSTDPEPGQGAAQHKSFHSYHVIYKDASCAFLLKPSLKPSAYYGRRPVAKIMKGVTVGIPVVRGFDPEAWERLHDKASRRKARQPSMGSSPDDLRQAVCPACRAQKDRGQITDLVLVCHGIGQKFAERVESFHFTHAINAFRREVNLELGNPAVRGILRDDQNGIMVLPVNWRHTLSLDDGGPMSEEEKANIAPDSFGLKDIEPKTIPAVRSLISDIMFDIPFYMSHHKGKMIEALVIEANRVYRLWCRNNPGFQDHGRVHLIGHSLGSAMAVDILSRQPNRPPPLDLSSPVPHTTHFEFDTKNLFLVGSPAGFFLLLERGCLVPRRGRLKPGADPGDVHSHNVTGQAGSFGCLAVDNIYNVLAKEDPIAYLLNGTIDPVYAASLQTAYVPSTATSFFQYIGDAVWGLVPGATRQAGASGVLDPMAATQKPLAVTRLPSQLELEVHDFTREEMAERKAYLLNDNGQIDYFLRSGGGPLEIQYLNMLSAHSSYWLSRDFIRMLCMEVGRRPGRAHALPAMRAQRAKKPVLGA